MTNYIKGTRLNYDPEYRFLLELDPDFEAWRVLVCEWPPAQLKRGNTRNLALTAFFVRYLHGLNLDKDPATLFAASMPQPDLWQALDLDEKAEANGKITHDIISDFSEWVLRTKLAQPDTEGHLVVPAHLRNPFPRLQDKLTGKGSDITFTHVLVIDPRMAQWQVFAAEWLADKRSNVSGRRAALDRFLVDYILACNLPRNPVELFRRSTPKPSFGDITLKAKSKGTVGSLAEGDVKLINYVDDFLDWVLLEKCTGDRSMRKAMVDKDGCQLSIRRQCELLGVNRNRLEAPVASGLGPEDLAVARRIDELHLRFPEFGARRMSKALLREGMEAGRRGVGRIMETMGLEAIYRKPRTSLAAPGRPKYPYLLRDHVVTKPDEAWCADVTYIPMARGFAYLVAVMDWNTRAVLSWKLSNTLDGTFCVEAFREALEVAGKAPEIFNTDQGCQFTAKAWLEAVEGAGAKVSMDGKGRWMDNVFIERLWRSVKHEGVYLWAHETVHELERALAKWFEEYNRWKPHQSLGYMTPWECYRPQEVPPWKRAA